MTFWVIAAAERLAGAGRLPFTNFCEEIFVVEGRSWMVTWNFVGFGHSKAACEGDMSYNFLWNGTQTYRHRHMSENWRVWRMCKIWQERVGYGEAGEQEQGFRGTHSHWHWGDRPFILSSSRNLQGALENCATKSWPRGYVDKNLPGASWTFASLWLASIALSIYLQELGRHDRRTSSCMDSFIVNFYLLLFYSLCNVDAWSWSNGLPPFGYGRMYVWGVYLVHSSLWLPDVEIVILKALD